MRKIGLLWGVLLLPALLGAEGTPASVQVGAEGKSWVIGNSLVEREVRFDPVVGLYTASWKHKVTGTDFMRWAQQQKHWGAEFAFQVDGLKLAGTGRNSTPAFEFVGADTRDASPAGKVLVVKLRAREKPLELEVFYAVYDGHPVVRKWIGITNRGNSPVTISQLAFEDVNLSPADPGELQVSGFYGIMPREIFFTGRVEDTAILLRNSRTGEGCVVMNEAPGWTKRTEMKGWDQGVAVMYDTDIFPFERRIAPGETFASAKSGVAFFVEGQGPADPRWVMPTYVSQVLMKKGGSYQPPWVYNTWEPFYGEIDEATTRALIPGAARMGLDIITIDDGWQAEYAENEINHKSFPGGLDEIRATAEGAGMRLGLWVPLAAVGTHTAAYREHPEWLCRDGKGQPKLTGTAAGSRAVMCLATPYRKLAASRLNDLIARYHLKYVKIDLTTAFNTYGEAPGCYAAGHDHQTWAESMGRIYEGIQYVTDQIYREHPDVLLDLTFELWGQKHVIDYGLLAAGDLDWLSNVNDESPEAAGPRQVRTLLYHRALAIPVETMLIGNLRATTPSVEERFATAIGSAPLFLGDLRKLALGEVEWYGEKIRWFKDLRKAVPINEGFFPLGSWMQPGVNTWDGFARLSRQGEGLIAIFKNESGVKNAEIKLPAFPPGQFRVRSIMTGQAVRSYSGEQIRRGIAVQLPPKFKAEVLEIRKQ